MASEDAPTDPARLGEQNAASRETFTALHTLLMSVESVEGFLQELAELAATLAPEPLSCGITASYDGRPLTVSSSDAFARALDEKQYHSQGGPCLQSMGTGEIVHIADCQSETRWPEYVRVATDLGLRSSLSLPVIVAAQPVGAINLYSSIGADVFSDEVRARAEVFAAQAATALLLSMRQVRSRETTQQQLETALNSRSEIDQAIGILMGQQRCTADEAFALLRTHSQNTNRRLRDVAADLVQRTSTRAEDDAAPST